MQVEEVKVEGLDRQVLVKILKNDYTSIEEKKLKEFRRTADLKGFRKGNVPMALVKKYYGERALLDAINDLASEQLEKYISDNNFTLCAEPLISEDQKPLELISGNDFELTYDLGIRPKVELSLSKEDVLPYYNIEISSQAKQQMKDSMLSRLGKMEESETLSDNSLVVGDFVQGEKKVEAAIFYVDKVMGEKREELLKAKKGDSLEINVNECFENESDRASMLKMSKEELANMDPVFTLNLREFKDFVPAKENQDTYDQLFPPKGSVKTPDEFDKKVEEVLANDYKAESDYRLSLDLKHYILDKFKFELPKYYLRRWLKHINENKISDEEIDKHFDSFLKDYSWQQLRDMLLEKYSLNIDKEELVAFAREMALYQYAMYGFANPPEEMLNSYIDRIFNDEAQVRRLYDQLADKKALDQAVKDVSLDEKSLSYEQFKELKQYD